MEKGELQLGYSSPLLFGWVVYFESRNVELLHMIAWIGFVMGCELFSGELWSFLLTYSTSFVATAVQKFVKSKFEMLSFIVFVT